MGYSGSLGFAWVQVNPFKSLLSPTWASPLFGAKTHGQPMMGLAWSGHNGLTHLELHWAPLEFAILEPR